MPQKTDLDVSPYWDDWELGDDFYRVLYRPSFAVQARELSSAQSILQNQIEQFGSHMFKEGTIVIPGHIGYDSTLYAVKIQPTYLTGTVADYLSSYKGAIVTGGTSGVTARVIDTAVATTGGDPDTLWVKYIKPNETDNSTITFSDDELISADATISTYTYGNTSTLSAAITASATTIGLASATDFPSSGSIKIGEEKITYTGKSTNDLTGCTRGVLNTTAAAHALAVIVTNTTLTSSAQLLATSATATGSSASVQAGIFFIRGFFVQNASDLLILDKYTNTPSYRVGFNITETLVTPEEDPALLDNAAGSSNYAAKGAHRLKITLTLAKKTLTETDDSNFLELIRIENGEVLSKVNQTKYSIVADMIARRTHDESGDYVVKYFDIEAREHLNTGTNRGIYTAASGGDATKLVQVVGPGKAYVNGFEIETVSATYVNQNKARETSSRNNDFIPFSLGNYTNVTKIYGEPDVTKVGSDIDAFGTLKLYDERTATRGTPAGALIGYAKSRAFEYSSGTVGASASNLTSVYRHYLFDINMFNFVDLNASTTLTANAVVIGQTSGATGVVVAGVTAAQFTIMQQSGTFKTGETITSSVNTDTQTSTILATTNSDSFLKKNFSRDVKQIYMDVAITGSDYTANTSLNDTFTLTGEVSVSGTTVTGTNTDFLRTGDAEGEVSRNDIIQLPTGAAGAIEEFALAAGTPGQAGSGIESATKLKLATAASNAVTSVKASRIRAGLNEQEETILIYKMPKNDIKTLLDSADATDTTFTVRRQFTGTSNASSEITFTAPTGQSWDSYAARDYTLALVDQPNGGGAGAAGDIIAADAGTFDITGQTLEITDVANFGGANVDVKLFGTLSIALAGQATKIITKMAQVTINKNAAGQGPGNTSQRNVYGFRVADKSLSLNKGDGFQFHAVYESASITTVPTPPILTIASASGTFTTGEVITGGASGATGRVIIDSNPSLKYVILSGTFTTLDTITGGTSGKTATVSAVVTGDTNITSSFAYDTGQRDSFYDIARLVRKPDAITPVGQILIIHDYFTHGTGDYFSVDSYTGQVDYADIPDYTATKVDPDSRSPKGLYELRDALDFRPMVGNIDNTTATVTPFSFNSRDYESSGASIGDMVKPDDNMRADYSFYLPRKDILYLDELGNFKILEGISSEQPAHPDIDENVMTLANIDMAPYTYDDQDLRATHADNRRYTMRDIGKLDRRIGNLEYYTTLGLLEKEAQSFQTQDANGLDRFKSGFVVDNFYGHNIGDVLFPDYHIGVDPEKGLLRPESSMDMVKLIEENTTDAQRTADNYAKTGDLITLPYTHEATITQPYSSRVEYINPFAIAAWIGTIDLTPATDIWMDTNRVPSVTVNVEGNYDQMVKDTEGQLGTIWNDWNTIWSGNRREEDQGRVHEQTWRADNPWAGTGVWGGLGMRAIVARTVVTEDIRQVRTGVTTRLTERIDHVSQGDRQLNMQVIPWMRSIEVAFTAENLKPNTRIYTFFDRVDVNAETRPVGGSAASTTIATTALTKAATTMTVTSTTGFPTTGSLSIGPVATLSLREKVTYTGITATTFTGVSRNTGIQFDEPQEWPIGTVVSMEEYGASLITNNLGTLSGVFKIPNTDSKRFRVGRKTFRLTDSSDNNMTPGFATTAGEATYEARGRLQTVQETILAVRNAEVTRDTTSEEQMSTASTRIGERVVGWWDPLAQTFLVERDGGEFLTKLDIYFSHKDDDLPVTLQLRNVVNGYPGKVVLPFSQVVKHAADITVSADSTVAIPFVFDSPVYVKKDVEYCIVLLSNSDVYRVWISKLGEIDTGGARAISSQPHLGSLFKSQNASTWTASQYEDLKFTMYRANFDTSVTSTYTMVNEELTADSGHIETLKLNPIITSNTNADVKVKFKNHGMYASDNYVTLSDVKSDVKNTALDVALTSSATTITCDDVSNFPSGGGSVLIDSEIITYTATSGTTLLTTCVRGTVDGDGINTTAVAHEDGSLVQLYMLAGIPLIEINKTHTSIAFAELDSFTLDTTTVATSSLTGGGSNVVCTRNIMMDVMQPLLQTMELPGTTISTLARTTTGTSADGSETSFTLTPAVSSYGVPPNGDYYYDNPQMIASQINETQNVGGKSFILDTTLTTNVDNLSPVIDEQRRGIIAISNRLNRINDATDVNSPNFTTYYDSATPTGDNNAAIYVTRKIALSTPATAIQVILDAAVMDTSSLVLLYKILRTDASDEDFDDIGWTFFNTTGVSDSAATLPVSKNIYDFKERKYTAGKRSNDTTIAPLDEFISFAIKIVMKGTNSSIPPLVKDFRAIALAL